MSNPLVKVWASWYGFKRRQAAGRRSFELKVDGLLEELDLDRFEKIRSAHGISNPGINVRKYLELGKWMDINLRRARDMGLDLPGPKRRVLDLGSGAGYFLYVAKRLGNEVLGLDIAEPAWYGDVAEVLGVPRVIQRIERRTPLRDLGEPFDCVTGFMICFNDHYEEEPWGIEEWRFFLDDLWTHLRPGALVWLELNPRGKGVYCTPELKAFFESRGAIVDGKRLVWGMGPLQYRALKRASEAVTKAEIGAGERTAEGAEIPVGARTTEG